MIREGFAPFREMGLDLVIELGPDDANLLREKLAGIGIHYLGIETEFELYSPQWIQSTIHTINDNLQAYRVIYLTSSNTVLGVILGCFLVERGMTGKAALRRLKQLRQYASEPWLPFPTDLQARKVIKR